MTDKCECGKEIDEDFYVLQVKAGRTKGKECRYCYANKEYDYF